MRQTRVRHGPLVAVALLLALLAWPAAHWQKAWQADYWQQQLADGDASQAADAARVLASLGQPGRTALVGQLESSRPEVINAVRDELRHVLETWRRATPAANRQRLLELAELLAEIAPRTSVEGQRVANELALALLKWPQELDPSETTHLAECCQQVLAARTAAGTVAGLATIDLASPSVLRPANARQMGDGLESDRLGRLTPDELRDLPGGGVPLEAVVAPLPPAPPEVLLAPSVEAASKNHAVRAAQYAVGERAEAAVQRASAQLEASRDTSLAASSEAALPPIDSGTDAVELCRQLHQPDRAAAAEAELAARGFSARFIELGRHLTHPDPAHRQQFAVWLPQVRDVNIRPWLVHLSRDEDAEVRHVVVGIMATTNDRDLLAVVKKMAQTDVDERVRASAARLLAEPGR